mgnify:CR=1 FL=1
MMPVVPARILGLCLALFCAAGTPRPAASASPQEIETEIAAVLHRTITTCWSLPATAAAQPVITYRIHLDRGGALVGEPELLAPAGKDEKDPIVASARRAILRCAPFTALQPYAEHYDVWKQIDLRFDTSDLQ